MKRLVPMLALLAFTVSAETVKGIPGDQYALVIGIEQFKDQAIAPLRFCVEDAKAFRDLLVNPHYGRYPRANTALLLNGEATTPRIKAELEKLAARAAKDDTVTIFFSSHGYQDPKGRSFWVTYDSVLDRESALKGNATLTKGTSLDNDAIASLFDGIKAHRLVVFLDCCFSADTVLRTTRGVSAIVGTRKKKVADPFAQFKGKGRVIIASSDGNQKSTELPGLKHGAFTYYTLKGLKGEADENTDNVVEVLELWDYLETNVEQAARGAGTRQKPTMTTTKFTHHFPLTTYPLLTAAAAPIPEPTPMEQAPPLPHTKPQVIPEPAPKQEGTPPPNAEPMPEVPPVPEPAADYVEITTPQGSRLLIGAREVTNAEFAEFVQANLQWRKDNIDPRYHDGDYLKHWNGNTFPEGKGGYPVVYVSWFAAKAFAEWRGARLPTEAEWEAAAGGPDGTRFPWGNDWDLSRCNSGESPTVQLAPATSHESGSATWPRGKIFNLAGNAWEWCDDFYYQYDAVTPEDRTTARAIKGGSFCSDRLGCLVGAQVVAAPRLCSSDGGVRLFKGKVQDTSSENQEEGK